MKADQALFISVEGGEGVGKSSFVKGLTKSLRDLGLTNLLLTREPGGTPLADALRSLFVSPPEPSEKLEALTELMMVSAGRLQHVTTVIQPSLDQGRWVLCDRYADSAAVYQMERLPEKDRQKAEVILEAGTKGLWPHLTFLLDCEVSVSLPRLKSRHASTAAETPSRYDLADAGEHESKRREFLKRAQIFSDRFVVLNAARSEAEVLQEGLATLQKRFATQLSAAARREGS